MHRYIALDLERIRKISYLNLNQRQNWKEYFWAVGVLKVRGANRPNSVRKPLIAILLLIFMPIGVSATSYWFGDRQGNWQTADQSSAGLLPTVPNHPDALIRVYAARTVR